VHRIAVELVNAGESEAIAADRAARRAWLESRDYRVIDMLTADIERALEKELAGLEAAVSASK
jgi:tRNA/rRNA methyltransferase